MIAASFSAALFASACAPPPPAWTPSEQPHYTQWERDTHRGHVDFQKRNDSDRREYWSWRRQHPD